MVLTHNTIKYVRWAVYKDHAVHNTINFIFLEIDVFVDFKYFNEAIILRSIFVITQIGYH